MDEQQVERPRSRERVGASESSDDTTSLPPPSSLSPVDINTSPPQSPNKKNSHAAINDGNLEKPQMMSTIPVISQSNSDVDNMPAPAVTLSEEVVAIEDKPPPHLSSSSTISATESMHPPPPRSSTLTLVNNKSMAPPASSPSTRVSSLKPASPSMQLREPTSSPESLQSASENGLQVEDLHGMDRTDDILLEDPNQPIVDFSWEDMQQRYHDTVKELEKDEQRIFEQFDRLCNFFNLWSQALPQREVERSFKRLKTQMAFVQHEEDELEERRLHHIKVIDAFKNAMGLAEQRQYQETTSRGPIRRQT